MGTITAVSGTIASLGGVITTLATSEVRAPAAECKTKRDAQVTAPENWEPPAMSASNGEIDALKTALAALESESKTRLQHQRFTLGEKRKRSVAHFKRQLAAKDGEIADMMEKNAILIQEATLEKERNDALIMETQASESHLITENQRLSWETERMENEIDILVGENKEIVALNQSLTGEITSLKADNTRLVGANQRLTYENGLRDDLYDEHQAAIAANEHLTDKVASLVASNTSLTEEMQLRQRQGIYLLRENTGLAEQLNRTRGNGAEKIRQLKDLNNGLVKQVASLKLENQHLVDQLPLLKEEGPQNFNQNKRDYKNIFESSDDEDEGMIKYLFEP
jgi:ABC-type uncharacterized transport system permease subunit